MSIAAPQVRRVRVVFASYRHAVAALALLSAHSDLRAAASVVSVPDGPGNDGLAIVDVDVTAVAEERVVTLLRGVHGIPVELPA